MRLIWTSTHIDEAKRFSAFLHDRGIDHTLEGVTDKDWGSENYGTKEARLWIHDEDQIGTVEKYLEQFQQNPHDARFAVKQAYGAKPIHAYDIRSPQEQYLEKKLHIEIEDRPIYAKHKTKDDQRSFRLTNCIVFLCSALLLLVMWSERNLPEIPIPVRARLLTVSPIEKTLLYDYPLHYELLDKIIALYGYDALVKPQDLPSAGKFLYQESLHTPTWEGLYSRVATLAEEIRDNKQARGPFLGTAPLFEKISQGQLFRLATPMFLHGGILHLFFNMVWLLLIGTQMEDRLGLVKYGLFILIVGVVSNTVQYLISGPGFLGFSGVICGMALFIRARQKSAPWEGYQMATATFQFILFFIGTLAGLSAISFLLAIYHNIFFPIQIANSAHIAGAISGWILGKMKVFEWNR